MEFKTALSHYKDGTATEEERGYIEKELEKAQLIAQCMDVPWDNPPMTEEVSGSELKRIRRNLRLRNISVVLTSLILVFAILIGVIHYAIPAVEKQYWDPTQETYVELFPDLSVTLGVFAELFCPAQAVRYVTVQKTGFANYDISIEMTGTMFSQDETYYFGNIEKGKITLPKGIWDLPGRIFANTDGEIPDTPQNIVQEHNDYVCDILESFPDYTKVFAAVSFPADLSMDELIKLEETYQNTCRFGWIAIRAGNFEEKVLPLCGMKPSAPSIANLDALNEIYPYFQVSASRFYEDDPGFFYEEHFKTLLRFSIDQVNAGTGLTPPNWYNQGYHSDAGYYEKALAYVEENGVYTYGAYVYATPDTLLEMMEKGIICDITYQDHWIDFYPGLH